MPIRTLEVVSLGQSQKDPDAPPPSSGRVQSIPVQPLGSSVQAGQVLMVLHVDDGTDNGESLEVVAPQAGTMVQCHVQVHDAVTVGDPLVSIDVFEGEVTPVDNVAPTIHTTPSLDESLLHYLNSGDRIVPESFWTERVRQHTDLLELLQLSSVLQQYPTLRTKQLVLLERVLELQQAAGAPSDVLADSYIDLGTVLYHLGDLDASLVHLDRALELLQPSSVNSTSSTSSSSSSSTAAAPSAPAKVAACHLRRAAVLQRQGDFSGSFDAFQKALELQREAYGTEHPSVAATLNNLGAIQYMRGNWKEAVQYYEESLALHLKVHGQDHVDTAGSYHNLATATKHSGHYNKALELERTALAIRTRVLGPDHPDTAASHASLAHLSSELGELEGAQEQYEAALRIQESVHGKLHPITASTSNNLGAVLYQRGNFAAAVEHYQRGLDALRSRLPENGPTGGDSTTPQQQQQFQDAAMAHNNVGMALLQLGQGEKALEHHRMAKDLLVRAWGSADDPNLASTVAALGTAHRRLGQLEEALADYRQAHTLLVRGVGSGAASKHPDVASSHNNLGLVLAQLGRFDEALVEYRAARAVFGAGLGPRHPHLGACHYNAALVHMERGDVAAAQTEAQAALALWEETLGPDHPQTQLAATALAEWAQNAPASSATSPATGSVAVAKDAS